MVSASTFVSGYMLPETVVCLTAAKHTMSASKRQSILRSHRRPSLTSFPSMDTLHIFVLFIMFSFSSLREDEFRANPFVELRTPPLLCILFRTAAHLPLFPEPLQSGTFSSRSAQYSIATLLQAAGAAPGFCMQCKTERATRVCDQCTFDRRRNLSWGGGRSHLCFVCFAVRDGPENWHEGLVLSLEPAALDAHVVVAGWRTGKPWHTLIIFHC